MKASANVSHVSQSSDKTHPDEMHGNHRAQQRQNAGLHVEHRLVSAHSVAPLSAQAGPAELTSPLPSGNHDLPPAHAPCGRLAWLLLL